MWPLSVLKYQTVLYPSNKEGGLKTSHGTAGHELAIRFNKFFTASLDLSRRSASADTSLHKTTSDVELLNSSLFLSDEDPRRSTQLLDFVRSHLFVMFTSRSQQHSVAQRLKLGEFHSPNTSLLINLRSG